MKRRAENRDHALITLVSQGSYYQREHPPCHHDRKWDVTFAADPGQIDHRNGPSASAGRWCTGQNGGIQCGVAQYEQFERLVGEVRATLVKDLLMGYLNCNSSRYQPRSIVYAFECRKGRHRSVAVCELLAHCMHTCGMSNVRVLHQHIHLHRSYDCGRDHVWGSCGCPNKCKSNPSKDRQDEWQVLMTEARRRARTAWREYGLE